MNGNEGETREEENMQHATCTFKSVFNIINWMFIEY